jgi:hypothetical protein
MVDKPQFPSAVLNSWLGMFCATVALITVWVIPIGLLTQVILTALFALVPLVVVIFWIGRFVERRHHPL